jgi:hypothetical protein
MAKKLKSYAFDVGNSNIRPLEMVLRVKAFTKKEAVTLANDFLANKYHLYLPPDKLNDSIEYCNVYFSGKLRKRDIFDGDTETVISEK